MTPQSWLVLVGALAMPISGIVGAYLTYRSMNKTTKENSAAVLINAAHGVSKDLIAQLATELVRVREQMSTTEQAHMAEMHRMSEALREADAKIAALTDEVRALTRAQEDYERVVAERDQLRSQLQLIPTQRTETITNGKGKPRQTAKIKPHLSPQG